MGFVAAAESIFPSRAPCCAYPHAGDALASCHATTLSSTSQPSNTAAPLSHHLDTLITTCFTVLRSHNDTEDVTTPGATAYAQLVTKLPPNEIFTRIDTDVRRVLGGGAGAGAGEEPAQCELALRLLDQYVLCALGEEGVVRGRVTEGDWLGLVGYVGERVMESDVDQGAQQVSIVGQVVNAPCMRYALACVPPTCACPYM